MKPCTVGGPECSETQKCEDVFDDGSVLVCIGNSCTTNDQCTFYELCIEGFCLPACGDGVTAKPEECDDGNDVDDDTCSVACKLNPVQEVEPNNDKGQGYVALVKDLLLVGDLGNGDVEDWIQVTVPVGSTTLVVTTRGAGADSCGPAGAIDTNLEIFDLDGTTVLNENDDVGFDNYCSSAGVTGLGPGVYYVRVTRSALCADCAFGYGVAIHVLP